jgi:hypothetical protein
MDKLIKIVDVLGSVVDALSMIHAALSGITDKLKKRPGAVVVSTPSPSASAAETVGE